VKLEALAHPIISTYTLYQYLHYKKAVLRLTSHKAKHQVDKNQLLDRDLIIATFQDSCTQEIHRMNTFYLYVPCSLYRDQNQSVEYDRLGQGLHSLV